MTEKDPIPEWFDAFAAAYKEQFGWQALLINNRGEVIAGAFEETDCPCGSASAQRRLEAVEQTLYWGDTVINLCCEEGYAMWGVPVMHNNEINGGLLVQGVDLDADPSPEGAGEIQKAADALLEWALRDNHTSKAAVELARERASKEKARFYALEDAQQFSTDDLRNVYLREEPQLLAAIKQGESGEARSILNRILASIYSLGGERMDLLKSCILELVVMMSRAAVEAGAEPATLLGANYRSLTRLSEIDDEEDLAVWVRFMLDTLIEAIRSNDQFPHSLLLMRATSYMREHLGENLRRDEVARFAGVSAGHLAHIMTEHLGHSFTDLLLRMRVDRAKELLHRSQLSLSSIAAECGFYDQSHLNKVFRKLTHQSPSEYRRLHRLG